MPPHLFAFSDDATPEEMPGWYFMATPDVLQNFVPDHVISGVLREGSPEPYDDVDLIVAAWDKSIADMQLARRIVNRIAILHAFLVGSHLANPAPLISQCIYLGAGAPGGGDPTSPRLTLLTKRDLTRSEASALAAIAMEFCRRELITADLQFHVVRLITPKSPASLTPTIH